ncbi:DUF4399 domain-containing protein [Paludibacterium purpuratum]|uniref:Uncharacterized protein DUF4399 n=1 Tax=Paludibacterium purpuratum TaxID=1144873 RepID=A0A4R7BDH4_9NEIS|nr:DUF4399 domain-containing protein [Paludibacterium purpuratum]TDR82991.1 uncharacterized protein DUF4399 [Paludibacterium purpuratum]
MKSKFSQLAAVLVFLCTAAAQAFGATVFFIGLEDGATVESPVKMQFGVEGMTVRPAGTMEADTGHFHLLIDTPALPKGELIPFDESHLHFGKGQTEVEIPLPPGNHTLTLLFADGQHHSYGPELSQTIKIHVQ